MRSLGFFKLFAISSLLLASTAPAYAEQTIVVDQSRIAFALTQMNVPVEGHFKKFSGTAQFDRANPEKARIAINIDLASIDLGNAEGEAEATKGDWFNTATFPQATFESTQITAKGADQYEAQGKLTIKGVTSPITAPFSTRENNGLLIAEGKFTLQRLDYKLGEGDWADTSTLANEVVVTFTVALTQPKP